MYKILKQRVSMSVLDSVLALDPMYSKIISAENDRLNAVIEKPWDRLGHIDEE